MPKQDRTQWLAALKAGDTVGVYDDEELLGAVRVDEVKKGFIHAGNREYFSASGYLAHNKWKRNYRLDTLR